MNKHKIFIPMFIVIVIIILILSYSLLFGKKANDGQNNEIIEKVKEIFPATVTVTPNPYSDSGTDEDIIKEFNTAERAEYTYTLSNGEIYTIAIPKGLDPPPLAVVEKMYRIEKGL